MAVATSRLIKDLRHIEQDPSFNIMLDPFPDTDMLHWHGIIIGPIDTPYENGIFHFKADFPEDYPFHPPKIQFLTKIFHPNVFSNGFVCMNILQEDWAVAYTIDKTLLSFVSLLYDPHPNEPANVEAAQYYQSDREKYNQIAHEWTQNYAVDYSLEQTIETAKQAITHQLNDIQANHSSDVNIRPLDIRNLFYWQGTIIGPPDSPYQGRILTINIRFPLNYPEKPPSIVFRSFMYHPNIDQTYGFIGKEESKKKWTSNIAISKILQDLFALLSNPNLDDPSNDKAARVYKDDREKYNRMAREATYAAYPLY
jgi:ubiquitin-conjugating enzyme E2 D/E